MTILSCDFLKNEIIHAYIELQYNKAVIKSYGERPLKRDLFLNYKSKFIEFIDLIQKSNSFYLLESIDDLATKNKPDYSPALETMSFGLYKERDYDLLLLAAPDSVKNLSLERTISYPYLRNQYKEAFNAKTTDSEKEQLNKDFLIVFSKFYGDATLSSSIELYVDILMDEKEFDGVLNIESLVFDEEHAPNKHLLKQSFNLFLSIVKCYYYIKNITKGQAILEKLYNYLDEHFNTQYIYTENEMGIPKELAIPEGVILKSDRKHYNAHLQNLPTNWTFSNTTQVKNAFRLNLINEDKYKTALKRHEQNELQLHNTQLILEDYLNNNQFLELEHEKQIEALSDPTEKRVYPEVYFFDELKHEQLAEYKTAFSNYATLHSIGKYAKIRLSQLERAFQNNQHSADEIIKEIKMIGAIYKNESINHLIENIQALDFLKQDTNADLLVKINEIRTNLKIRHESICVSSNNQYYRFYGIFEYKEAIKLPTEVIEIAANGGNISEADWWAWHNQSNNQEITFAALRLEDKRYKKDNKTLVSTRKTDAPLLVELLETDCSEFMAFFNDHVKPNQSFRFIGAPISKLITAYITIKNHEKAMYWADQFLTNIQQYNPQYPGCDLAEITDKKEKCLKNMNSYSKT
jgi:uncharacterized protein YlaN (UPF0358 family)